MAYLVASGAALVVLAGAVTLPVVAAGPSAQASRTCSDYSNQRDAQLNKDTRDADGDGIYCESLPCPCLKPGTNTTPPPRPAPHEPSAGAHCGTERWPVKTLSDSRAGLVRFRPRSTTVDKLRSLSSPGVGFSTPRLAGVETHTYRVKADLIEMELEDDRDIHLVISEPGAPTHTMIVEFPDVRCQGAISSKKRSPMKRARGALVRACGSPSASSFRRLDGSATITGVGFFNVKHGQTGVAPNAIELHPVLRYRSGGCD